MANRINKRRIATASKTERFKIARYLLLLNAVTYLTADSERQQIANFLNSLLSDAEIQISDGFGKSIVTAMEANQEPFWTLEELEAEYEEMNRQKANQEYWDRLMAWES